MKKAKAIIKIVLCSVLAATFIGILVVGIRVGKNGDDFMLGFTSYRYDNPESYIVGGGEINENINSAEIEWISGEVNIFTYDSDKIIIEETKVSDEANVLRYKVENGKLKIHYGKSEWKLGFSNLPKKTLTVKIPKSMAESFLKLEIDVTSADTNINGIKTNSLEIDNVSGKTTINGVTANDFDLSTVSGDVNAKGSFTNLEFESVSGKINLTSETVLKKVECDSTSGDTTLRIPENGFTAEFDSVSGDFNSDFGTVKKGNKYTSGDGSAEFEFDTVSGDVTIKR